MADPFLGEIKMFAGNFAPRSWAFCNGQLLSIAQNTALFSLLGTTYGGDGRTTFALPDLQSRVPMGWGNGPGLTPRSIGERSGAAAVTLTEAQMPAHTHTAAASTSGSPSPNPANRYWGQVPTLNLYRTAADVSMASGAIASVGGSQPHNNAQPYLVVNFIIAVQGIYPSRG
jgi:microcystin-dependent protein